MWKYLLLFSCCWLSCFGTALGPVTVSSDVTEIARLSLDTALFTQMVATDYVGAKAIYERGYNSCSGPRVSWIDRCVPNTLQNLTVERPGDNYSDAYKAFYGSGDSWNDFVLLALDGTGIMANKSATFRTVAAKKAVLGIGSNMVHDGLDHALDHARRGDFQSARASLDKSWAYYYGLDGLNVPAKVSGSRDVDFPKGLVVLDVIPDLYTQIQKAFSEGSTAEFLVEAVYKCMLITYVRATIKYANKVDVSIANGAYSAKYHAEGYTYWRAISGYVAKLNPSAAATIEALLLWTLSGNALDTDVHCKVKNAIEGAYPSLGIDCTMVGTFKDYADQPDICGSICASPGVTVIPVFGFPQTKENVFAPTGGYSAVSNTTTLAELSEDTKVFTSAVADYALAGQIYNQGMHALGYTLEGLNAENVGDTYYDAYASFYGSPKSWDDLINQALTAMPAKDGTFRQMILKKGVLGLVVLAVHERLDTALRLGESGKRSDAEAAAAVDEAWALYYGKEALGGKNSPWAVSGKRDIDFPTGEHTATAILPLFQQAQVALRAATYDADKASEAIAGIYRNIVITFVRAAIKYSYQTEKSLTSSAYSSKYHAEGYTYWRAVSAYVASLDNNAATIVENLLSWEKDEAALDPAMHCKVKQALESAYPVLGLDCSMVGIFEKAGYSDSPCSHTCVSATVSALPLGHPEALALPILAGPGLPDLGIYPPLNDVQTALNVGLDLKAFTSAIANYTLAREIYTLGVNSPGKTMQSLNDPHPGDPYWEAYRSFYLSNTSWDDLILLSLNDAGSMGSKLDVFRQMVAKKGALGLVAMAVHERLENAEKQAISGNYGTALQSWDDAWALYYGDGKSNPYAVSGKRDVDFPDGIRVMELMPRLFMQGQKHLEQSYYDIQKVREAKLGIYKGMLITTIRCAIKYSQKTEKSILDGQYSAKYHSEAYSYWRGGSAYIATFNLTAAQTVEDLLMWTLDEGQLQTTMHCQTKLSLESVYLAMGLDCSIIGNFKDTAADVCGACTVTGATLPVGIAFSRGIDLSSCSSDGSTATSAVTTQQVFCTVGEEFNGFQCEKCRPGFYNPQSDDTCKPCGPGFFTNAVGSFECSPCAEGTYAGGDVFTGNSVCKVCPIGKVAVSKGSNQCTACEKGSASNSTGGRACQLCPRGKYADEGSLAECKSCPAGKRTENVASQTMEDCGCPVNTYLAQMVMGANGSENMSGANGDCLACPPGMTCPGSSSSPIVNSGMWSSPADPLSVYECTDPVCIGGDPGSCRDGGRFGFLCMECPDGYNRHQTGCTECSTMNRLLLPVGSIFVAIGIVGVYYSSNSKLFVNATAEVVFTTVLGMAVTMFQMLGMYSYLGVSWSKVKNAEDITSSGKPFMGGFQQFGIGCVFGFDPVARFLLMVVIPFGIAAHVGLCFILSFPVSKCVVRQSMRDAWTWELHKAFNTLGAIYMAIFITLVTISISPFQTYSHPNEKDSVIRFPQVLIGDGDYWTMVVMSLFAICFFIVPYATACLMGVRKAASYVPSRYSQRGFVSDMELTKGQKLHETFRFVLYKFRPGCWWWGLAVLLRQLCLAFAPVLPSEEPHIQAVYICSVLSCYCITASSYFPWKSDLLNLLDIVQSLCLLTFMVVSTAFMEASNKFAAYNAFLITLFVIMVATLLFTIGLAILDRGKNGKQASLEHIFLSQGPPGNLSELWHEVVTICGELGVEASKELLAQMTVHDWRVLLQAASAWHAVAPNMFPARKAMKPRMVGLDHSLSYKRGDSTAEIARRLTKHSSSNIIKKHCSNESTSIGAHSSKDSKEETIPPVNLSDQTPKDWAPDDVSNDSGFRVDDDMKEHGVLCKDTSKRKDELDTLQQQRSNQLMASFNNTQDPEHSIEIVDEMFYVDKNNEVFFYV